MLGKAFCGNGSIHLNLAEFYEEDIGGQKSCAPISDQSSKWGNLGVALSRVINFLKTEVSSTASVLEDLGPTRSHSLRSYEADVRIIIGRAKIVS
jgi:hypothetical protein